MKTNFVSGRAGAHHSGYHVKAQWCCSTIKVRYPRARTAVS